jgi:hypothetical protein
MQIYKGGKIEEILGPALSEEVRAGRACPSLQLLCDIATAMEMSTAWVLGLED